MMRWASIAAAVACAGILCSAPARASSASAEETKWIGRARAVWRAYNYGSKAEQRSAERAVLSEGRRKAATELRRLLPKQPPSDALRLPVAFTMTLLDLDYPIARDALLGYARAASAPPFPGWPHLTSWVADPEAPESERDQSPEGVPGMLFDVYKRHHDPVLVGALLDCSRFADGALGESMASMLADLARDYPRALLRALRPRDKGVWLQTSERIVSLGIGLDKPPRKAFPGLVRVAGAHDDPLAPSAQRLLADMTQYQTRVRNDIAKSKKNR